MTFLFFGAKSLKTMLPTLPMLPPEKLTHQNHAVILSTHCKSSVGFRSSFPKGDNSPQSFKAVFLCLPFFNFLKFGKVQIIMTALFGQPFWLVVPFGDTANPLNTVANHFAVLRDGFTLQSKGITA